MGRKQKKKQQKLQAKKQQTQQKKQNQHLSKCPKGDTQARVSGGAGSKKEYKIGQRVWVRLDVDPLLGQLADIVKRGEGKDKWVVEYLLGGTSEYHSDDFVRVASSEPRELIFECVNIDCFIGDMDKVVAESNLDLALIVDDLMRAIVRRDERRYLKWMHKHFGSWDFLRQVRTPILVLCVESNAQLLFDLLIREKCLSQGDMIAKDTTGRTWVDVLIADKNKLCPRGFLCNPKSFLCSIDDLEVIDLMIGQALPKIQFLSSELYYVVALRYLSLHESDPVPHFVWKYLKPEPAPTPIPIYKRLSNLLQNYVFNPENSAVLTTPSGSGIILSWICSVDSLLTDPSFKNCLDGALAFLSGPIDRRPRSVLEMVQQDQRWADTEMPSLYSTILDAESVYTMDELLDPVGVVSSPDADFQCSKEIRNNHTQVVPERAALFKQLHGLTSICLLGAPPSLGLLAYHCYPGVLEFVVEDQLPNFLMLAAKEAPLGEQLAEDFKVLVGINFGVDFESLQCKIGHLLALIAVSNYSLPVLDYLELKMGALKFVCGGLNLLHIAAHFGDPEMVLYLIRAKGFTFDEFSLQGKTGLHYALENGHVEVAALFYKIHCLQSKLDLRDQYGKRPEAYAKTDSVVSLINNWVWDVDERQIAQFFELVKVGSPEHLLALVDGVRLGWWDLENALSSNTQHAQQYKFCWLQRIASDSTFLDDLQPHPHLKKLSNYFLERHPPPYRGFQSATKAVRSFIKNSSNRESFARALFDSFHNGADIKTIEARLSAMKNIPCKLFDADGILSNEKQFFPNKDYFEYPFSQATTNGFVHIVKWLVRTGRCVDARQINLGLLAASAHGKMDVVQYLTTSCCLDEDLWLSAMLTALEYAQREIVQYFYPKIVSSVNKMGKAWFPEIDVDATEIRHTSVTKSVAQAFLRIGENHLVANKVGLRRSKRLATKTALAPDYCTEYFAILTWLFDKPETEVDIFSLAEYVAMPVHFDHRKKLIRLWVSKSSDKIALLTHLLEKTRDSDICKLVYEEYGMFSTSCEFGDVYANKYATLLKFELDVKSGTTWCELQKQYPEIDCSEGFHECRNILHLCALYNVVDLFENVLGHGVYFHLLDQVDLRGHTPMQLSVSAGSVGFPAAITRAKARVFMYAVVLQRWFRCRRVRRSHMYLLTPAIIQERIRMQNDWGTVIKFRGSSKTWAELKCDLDMVQEQEGDDIALSVVNQCDDTLDDDKENVDDNIVPVVTPEITQEKTKQRTKQSWKMDNIKITQYVLKWYENADNKYAKFFLRRLQQLAAGQRSRILKKYLTGCKHSIYETYLDQSTAQRILWTECREGDKHSILIWYVVKHKWVDRYMRQIDQAEERLHRQPDLSTQCLESGENGTMIMGSDTMLPDPYRNTPLKLYEIKPTDFERMDKNWNPPMHLTASEKAVVEKPGTVLLIGRSGTGKTMCVANRISFDRHKNKSKIFKQAFVARSVPICKYVESLDEQFCRNEDRTQTEYIPFESLVNRCLRDIPSTQAAASFPRSHYVSYQRFCSEIYPKVKKETKIEPLIVWVQIQSFIKASIDSVMKMGSLSEMEYLNLPRKRCKLERVHRSEIYAVFIRYERFCKGQGLWDDSDRIMHIIGRFDVNKWDYRSSTRPEIGFDRIYCDEVQDFLNAEVVLLFLLCGNTKSLFLCGDTAQSVFDGVDFRFQEVRKIAFDLTHGNSAEMPPRVSKLSINFRSHSGLLNLAASILKQMFAAFPDGADKLAPDTGLFRGPCPLTLSLLQEKDLLKILQANERLILITRKERVASLQKLVGRDRVVLSIQDSKGLEFQDVAVVDFFCEMHTKHGRHWKTLFGDSFVDPHVFRMGCPEIERELKLLYTGITRCCTRLILVETKPTNVGTAFFRWAETNDLCERYNLDENAQLVTRDEWRIQGIEFAMHNDGDTSDTQWLKRAVQCFGRAGDKDLTDRALAQVRLYELVQTILPQTIDARIDTPPATCQVLGDCLAAGLVKQVLDVVDLLMNHADPRLSRFLKTDVVPVLERFNNKTR